MPDYTTYLFLYIHDCTVRTEAKKFTFHFLIGIIQDQRQLHYSRNKLQAGKQYTGERDSIHKDLLTHQFLAAAVHVMYQCRHLQIINGYLTQTDSEFISRENLF
jgi:hypothetical protein